jgi:hypothetical protein
MDVQVNRKRISQYVKGRKSKIAKIENTNQGGIGDEEEKESVGGVDV